MHEVKRTFFLTVAIVLATAVGVASASDASVWRHRQNLVDAFYKQPLKQQIATFATYGFDDQYAIYLYGNQRREPPAIYLAQPFAAQGEKVVRPLSLRLRDTKSDSTIRDLVLVFSEMNRQKSYAIANDTTLMHLLKTSVSEMKSPDWRAISEKELATIQP